MMQEAEQPYCINVQKYNDLLIHQGYSGSLEMQKLLNNATQRFAKEETLITIMKDEHLIGYSWFSKPGINYKNYGQELALDKDQLVIDCISLENTLPNSKIFKEILNFTIPHIKNLGIASAYICIPENSDKETTQVIESLNFKLVS